MAIFCKILVVLVIVVGVCNCLCGNTFKQATALVRKMGVEQDYIANKCVRNEPIETFHLISSSNTRVLQPGTFSNLHQLYEIELNGAGITKVEPGFLENTPRIKTIKMERNSVEVIQRNVFGYLNLRTLDLSSNVLTHIFEGAFEETTTEYLCLSDNRLERFNSDWFKNTKITALSMTHNRISALDSNTFSNIVGLRTVKLSYNRISRISLDTFSNARSLQTLYLPGNKLTDVSFRIENNLRNIDVSFNNISSIFLDDSSLWFISIYPNPFDCQCLRTFWNYAWRRKLSISETKSLKYPLTSEHKVCVVQNRQCDRKTRNFRFVQNDYFKDIDYNALGKPVYNKEDDFLDLGIIN